MVPCAALVARVVAEPRVDILSVSPVVNGRLVVSAPANAVADVVDICFFLTCAGPVLVPRPAPAIPVRNVTFLST